MNGSIVIVKICAGFIKKMKWLFFFAGCLKKRIKKLFLQQTGTESQQVLHQSKSIRAFCYRRPVLNKTVTAQFFYECFPEFILNTLMNVSIYRFRLCYIVRLKRGKIKEYHSQLYFTGESEAANCWLSCISL